MERKLSNTLTPLQSHLGIIDLSELKLWLNGIQNRVLQKINDIHKKEVA